MINGVILDVDGTFVDSNKPHSQAFEEAFRENGFSVPAVKVFPLIGMGGKKLVSQLIDRPEDSEIVQAITEAHGHIFKSKYLPYLKAFSQSRELVLKMIDSGFSVVIGSSAKEDQLEPLLKKAHINDLVPLRVSAGDVKNPKPEPDIIFAGLEKLKRMPEEVLMLGDTSYDIEAAQKAGVATVALRCGGWKDTNLQGAIAIYDDPADLLKNFSNSPFGENH